MIDDDSERAWIASGSDLVHALRVRSRRAVAILSRRPGVVAPEGLEREVLVRIDAEHVEQFRANPIGYIEGAVRGWNAAPESRIRSALHLLREVRAGRAIVEWHYVGGEA